ncbi:PPC domain-containing DNA-binding protein [uncultured Sphaerochaeta sp.]|uniref:PPC domain-containing DNA-binding protein n=1 Tax=uncultured Sphaerochaeta sp. TaxID=886478 RepID=UPI002A0A5AF9|nr:PPC domain-containing DNA-binding protein [uncultured Sphaerochaeta sp.]
MTIVSGKEQRLEIFTVGLEPGDLLLESIQFLIKDHRIMNGIVLTGFGTLDLCTMHYVADSNFPPTNVMYGLSGALELTSMSGIIANASPHIHITVSQGRHMSYGGHLEAGSRVLYLAEFSVLKLENSKLIREFDAERQISLLRDAKESKEKGGL